MCLNPIHPCQELPGEPFTPAGFRRYLLGSGFPFQLGASDADEADE